MMSSRVFVSVTIFAFVCSNIFIACKGNKDVLPDSCLLKEQPSQRLGKWNLIAVDQGPIGQSEQLTFINDTLFRREWANLKFVDTSIYHYLDCDTVWIAKIPKRPK